MKFQLQAVSALVLASGSAAFAPMPPAASRTVSTPVDLNMAARDQDLGKAAMSLLTAGVLAISTVTTALPIEPVFAANPATKQEKVDMKKLAPEEKTKIAAKKNLDLANASLKEYTKLTAEAKSADTKAMAALQKQEALVASNKKVSVANNDKLSTAKNQKMPQAAIKELTEIANKSKETLKVEEKKLAELSKIQSKTGSELKNAQSGVDKSKAAIESGKLKLEKAEKEFKKYQKKVEKQKKKEAKKQAKAKKAAQKALAKEEKKLKELQAQTKKLESLKTNSAKELQSKQKQIESELKSMEKMKSAAK